MAGIERVHILSGFDAGDGRDKKSLDMEAMANEIYFRIFEELSMPLQDGILIRDCENVKDAKARYDYIDGIDCILNCRNGHRITIQEKFLFTNYHTATFTDTNKFGDLGSYYTCIAQYYFVGYAIDYPDDKRFREYILIDFPGLLRWDAKIGFNWKIKRNLFEGLERINFRYLNFDDIPDNLIIYKSRE